MNELSPPSTKRNGMVIAPKEVMAVIIVVGGIATTWGVLGQRVNAQEKGIVVNQSGIKDLDKRQDKTDIAITQIKGDMARMADNMEDIEVGQREFKQEMQLDMQSQQVLLNKIFDRVSQ